MTWYEQMAAVFSVKDEDKPTLMQRLPGVADIPQSLLGFDLVGAKQSMKGYFGPLYQHVLTGENTNPLLFRTLRNLKPLGEGFDPALGKIEAFMATEPHMNVNVVGIDCIEPALGARAKLYTRLRPNENAFELVRRNLTLGGRLTDRATLESIGILRGIWHHLLGIPEWQTESDESKLENETPDPHSGIMISWEIQPGKEIPSAKVYVPLWKFHSSNKSIAESYEKIMAKWGWSFEYSPLIQGA